MQPETQSARSRRSYGKIGDCEQSICLLVQMASEFKLTVFIPLLLFIVLGSSAYFYLIFQPIKWQLPFDKFRDTAPTT